VEAAPDNNWRKYLVCECIDAYLPLDEAQQQIFHRLLDTEPYRGITNMMTSWHRQGFEEGQRRVLGMLLEQRFGVLSPEAQQRLRSWPADRLDELILAVWRAQSLQELGLEEHNGNATPAPSAS
jgi:hypothetical protein